MRTIWLVHFTGEEFPADDLGARALVSKMLGDKQDIAGLVLLDMIGFAGVGESQFQINPGPHAASLEMASVALDAAADQAPDLTPLLEPRYSTAATSTTPTGSSSPRTAIPSCYINEHINYFTRLMRAAYHDMSDTSDKVNFAFAVKLTKISIETVARLADVHVVRTGPDAAAAGSSAGRGIGLRSRSPPRRLAPAVPRPASVSIGLRLRQRDAELGAGLAARERDAAAAPLDRRLDDRQPEAVAGVGRDVAGPVEAAEDLSLLVGRDADAGVGDGDEDAGPVAAHRERDAAALRA